MKYYILLLLIICAQLRAHEPPPAPPATGKRAVPETVEQTEPAKVAKVEAAEEELSAFEKLPLEIREPILKALSEAKGFGNEKLYLAATGIRALRSGSQVLKAAIDDPEILGYIIIKLAKEMGLEKGNLQQYYKNILDVIIAFHTTPAVDWFRKKFNGDTNMYAALSRAIINFVFDNKFDIAKFLLELAYSPQTDTYRMLHLNTVNSAKQNLLMAVAKLADTKIMERTLKTIVQWCQQYPEAPNINWIDDNGQTALAYAVLNGNIQDVELLIELGALPIWRNEEEEIVGSALLPAAQTNNLALVERFLQFPEVVQNINYTNEDYREHPLEYAINNNNYAMFVRILAVPGIQLNGAMLYKALKMNRQMALDLIARGVNVNDDADVGDFPILALFTTDERGIPLFDDNTTVELLNILHRAAANSDQVLNVDRGDERHKNATPLIIAVQQGKYKTVEALLKGPADIYEKDKDVTDARAYILAEDEDDKTAMNYANDLTGPSKDIIKNLLSKYEQEIKKLEAQRKAASVQAPQEEAEEGQ